MPPVHWGGLDLTPFPTPQSEGVYDLTLEVLDLGDRMRAAFERDVANSERITLDQWRNRSLDLRLRELFGRLWQYWL